MLGLLLASFGCEDPPPPWAGQPDGRVRDESEPFLPRRSSPLAPDSASGPSGETSGQAPLPEEELLAPRSARHGGLWLSCHDRFEPSGEARRDVTRLELSCGPINGMARHGGLVAGELTAGQPAQHRFEVEPGDCLRVFAAGGATIDDLDLHVTDVSGSVLAEDATRAPFAILEPERPVCSAAGGELLLRITAARGAGPFAATIWTMPPRGSQ